MSSPTWLVEALPPMSGVRMSLSRRLAAQQHPPPPFSRVVAREVVVMSGEILAACSIGWVWLAVGTWLARR